MKASSPLIRVLLAVSLAVGVTPLAGPALAASPDVVISQVYGGGGNSGAPYANDFVELFNRGTSTVSLTGWSIQYASATGTGSFASNPITLLSGSLAPGQYYLLQMASGGAIGVPLPTPDAVGTVNMSATGGKVALVTTTTGLGCNGGSTPCDLSQLALIKDLVGYDGANFFEGSGAAPATTNTTAALRNESGCFDSDDNAADFAAGAPTPRNTASPLHSCCDLPYTPIYAIQGSGPTAAITGLVTTKGVVIADYEGLSPALRGFYLQDPVGDGDPTTSDGIWVFNGNNDLVNVGDLVYVTGTADEFQGQTEIAGVLGRVAHCGTGTVTPVDVTLPLPSADYLERYEGMLVHLPQTLYVTETFQLGRFGQVELSSGARLPEPTSVASPGAPALVVKAANDLNRIILDDDLNNQNPDPILFGRGGNPLSASNTLRGGDTATGIVGVMSYTWSGNATSGNAYRVRPIHAMGGGAPNFQTANPRPAAAPTVGGTIKVADVNLGNFFNTFGVGPCTDGVGGAPGPCRGANNLSEFNRQWPKLVAAIVAIDPDILGVHLLENDGYGPTSAIQNLVDLLNAATAPGTYAFVDADANTGTVNALGTDGIKVSLIYKPGSVTPVGQTAALNTPAFINGGDSGPRNRASLAQAFKVVAKAEGLVVAVNHLKSKGSACDTPDAGDGQGNCNQVRVNAVNELLSWLATDPTGTGDSDVLLIGDFNSYAMEDPITTLQGAGYTNLVASSLGPNAYGFVFDGQWGYFATALGSASIASKVTGTGLYHVNADEPSVLDYNVEFKSPGQIVSLYAPDAFRAGDNDPVVVGLNLDTPPVADAGGPYLGAINTAIAFDGSGSSDPDGDALTYSWTFGDGDVGSGATPTHSYTAPGIYDVCLTVSDGSTSSTQNCTIAVVYDPDAGFVTGGGWIISPAGAYVPDPGLTGKATFGFVSKYKKGATTPSGTTGFEFVAGNMDFYSDVYEWLVVNQGGTNAQFKGTGTINDALDPNANPYKFMLWATDGTPDQFRIKIWWEDGGGVHLVYDNGFDQPIGAGNIVVHTGGKKSGTAAAESDRPTDAELALYRPTPNPFNGTMRLAYAVGGAGARVEIAVFDLAGRRVRDLVSKFVGPGRYLTTWDGRAEGGQRAINGVYFIRATVGDERRVMRVAYMR